MSTMSPDDAPRGAARRWRRRLAATLLAVGAGVLAFLGFAGFGLWPIAFVAFVPMYAAVDLEPDGGDRRAVGLGLWFGFAAMAGGYYWVVDTIEIFGGFGPTLSVAFASILWLYQAGLFTLFTWLFHRARRAGFSAVFAAVPALAAAELLFPMLFPFYYGASFHMLPPLLQVADLGGPTLVSALATASSAAVYEVGRALWTRAPIPRRPVAAAAAFLAFALAYGAFRIAEVDARAAGADRLDVATVQTSMGIVEKRQDPREGLRRHLAQTAEAQDAPEGPPDLVVWAESGYSWFIPDGVERLAGRFGLDPVRVPLLFGGLSRREVDGARRSFNTAFLIDEDKRLLGTYDKTFLLAFGEYIPFGDRFPILYDWSPNTGRFTPGSHVRPLVLGDVRIATLICYEDILPAFVRKAVRAGSPHLLANLTNDAWFGDTQEPWVHLALAKLRAVEHHRALVRATNSGVSAIVDPVGRVITHGGVFTRDTLRAEVPLLDADSAYLVLGDWPGWLGLALSIWMGFVAPARRRRRAA